MTTPLFARIKTLIEANGPMDVATYMRLCLTDPEQGYYTTRNPIGGKGDFITAPEISQLFGELIGIWVLDIWQKLDAPSAFSLVEAGPGRATLMADMLRTIKKLSPSCAAATNVRLIEVSPSLKEIQKETLSPFGISLHWHENLDDIPDLPFILVANEFLDALPIHQYQFKNGKWAERAIGLSPHDTLVWGLTPSTFTPPLASRNDAPPEGAIFETSPAARTLIATLSNRIKAEQAAALFIDYGHLESGFGDTFQAVKNHAYADPLAEPGAADLTVHVDFEALQKIVQDAGLRAQTTTQGDFLLAMGLLERAGVLGAHLTEKQQKNIKTDVERLAAPEKMGNLFKVMAITKSGITPHGF